jgi:hypothetical protein
MATNQAWNSLQFISICAFIGHLMVICVSLVVSYPNPLCRPLHQVLNKGGRRELTAPGIHIQFTQFVELSLYIWRISWIKDQVLCMYIWPILSSFTCQAFLKIWGCIHEINAPWVKFGFLHFQEGKPAAMSPDMKKLTIQVVQGMHQQLSSMANTRIVVGFQVELKY